MSTSTVNNSQTANTAQAANDSSTSENSWSFGHPTALVPGMLADAIKAVLAVAKAYMEMGNIWGTLFQDQQNTQATMAQQFADDAKQLGKDEKSAAWMSGGMTMGSGLISLGTAGLSAKVNNSLKPMDEELSGMESTREFMENKGSTTAAAALRTGDVSADEVANLDSTNPFHNDMLDDLVAKHPQEFRGLKSSDNSKQINFEKADAFGNKVDGSTGENTQGYKDAIEQASPTKMEEIREKFDGKIEEFKGDYDRKANGISRRTMMWQQVSQNFGDVSKGFGTGMSSDAQKDQEIDKANQKYDETTMSMAASLAGTSANNANTYQQKSLETANIMSALASYNKMGG